MAGEAGFMPAGQGGPAADPWAWCVVGLAPVPCPKVVFPAAL